MPPETPTLLVYWESVIGDLMARTGRFPRTLRHSLAGRIDNLALDVLEAIIEARFVRSARAERLGDHFVGRLRDKYADKTRALEARIRAGYEELATRHAHADKLHHEALANAAACLQAHFTGDAMPDEVRDAWVAVKSTKAEVKALDAELHGLDDALKADIAKIRAHYTPMVSRIEERTIVLERDDIRFSFFGVLWVPVTRRPL